jgi:ABC-type polysaccharide/polyol phosphate transport system ATPase subunit
MKSAIEVKGLAKQYRIGEISSGTLVQDISRWWNKFSDKENSHSRNTSQNTKNINEFVWALNDINFTIKQGEVWGIIGPNGAGKSTLLKILSKITKPTKGEIVIDGRIASLLEVGTGFHPDMTGRDNIYMNGSIMGMRRGEINEKLEEIIEFSGVQQYIDTPVKHYSSGMKVRLGFAVAAHLDPEILIVDEVLAVGDAAFQKKCLGKMQEVSTQYGRTVLFVSHNMSVVSSLCSKGLLIKDGVVKWDGSISGAIEKYADEIELKPRHQFDPIDEIEACVLEFVMLNLNDEPTSTFLFGEQWKVKLLIKVNSTLRNLVVSIGMVDSLNQAVRTVWIPEEKVDEGFYEVVFIENDILFAAGNYKLVIGLSAGNRNFQYIDEGIYFTIQELFKDEYIHLKSITQKTGYILNPMKTEFNKIGKSL